ncbi:MAG: site-specific DNA-methyltransferase [Acidobacteria bacterium]|nr:site-specific DNA-methyltransferase [Acidobacteriota bacterium]
MPPRKKSGNPKQAKPYKHEEADVAMRPEVGTQARFTKKLPPKTYRYDSSLSPALDYDGQNHARELGEWLLRQIQEAAALPAPHNFPQRREFKTADGKVQYSITGLQDAVASLASLGKPFLNWAGKAERLSFDVPTMPLFVHERLSTKAILETIRGHKIVDQFDLFGDPQHSIADQVLRAYEHRDKWVNRMILGDSLVVMNSLLHYESLGGQVQMIYIDPPYGVSFGSNFQPFVRKRGVNHGEDEDMTREPEMVQAYRDTWELNLHSYLTYLRDRLFLSRELLHRTGSVFVQISDENLHHVKELLDEVFGADNFCARINIIKTAGQTDSLIATLSDSLLWYAKTKGEVKFHKLYRDKAVGFDEVGQYYYAEFQSGERRRLTDKEIQNPSLLPPGTRPFRISDLSSNKYYSLGRIPFEFEGNTFYPPEGRYWTHSPEGRERLKSCGRIYGVGNSVRFVGYLDDFPFGELPNQWTDTGVSGFAAEKLYVVQTNPKVIERCVLMTTDPGDLVLDPTCGGGTTAYVAEQRGRRWITVDTSRVPLALTRQRLLTATYPWYDLQDDSRGPVSGFIYKRKQNKKGEEVGGIAPHVTLKSIANNEPPEEEVLVDRPEESSSITRVTGPFCVEATIPTSADLGGEASEAKADATASFADRMLEVLRRSPLIRLPGNRTVTLKNIRPPAKTLSLSAEAMVDATANGKATLADAFQEAKEKSGQALPLSQKPVAIVFGPENGAVSERLVNEASREAYQKGYAHLYVIGFQIEPSARVLIDKNAEMGSIPATYVQATTDLTMGDLLKNMRSSQIFSVCGMPEAKLTRLKPEKKDAPPKYQVTLLGMDVFDPMTMETVHKSGNDVPAWFLDTNYNGLCFNASQAFFPRTSAWDSLRKALKGEYNESVWAHLAGNESAPFELGPEKRIAVKVIDDRGNELMVVLAENDAK